ncbi:hypothetical protein AQUCO_11900006v1 [Aquilegia coerulea]|uniref:BED-type domain-containing protein n=1 Tax=Aquilegia coerulea TaxID=218851 RepID=A0A2G5C1Z2_AQUCA|nr:hypothetical protein AQUCO_11900006v1 [Aquilegia coerulea]
MESCDVDIEEPNNLQESSMKITHSVGETRATQVDTQCSNPSKTTCSRKHSKVWDLFFELPLARDKIPREKCRRCGKVMLRQMKRCSLSQSKSPSTMRANSDICVFRKKIMLAIIRHDLPFQFVEYEGIRDALRYIHEVNLIVQDELKKMDDSVIKIRESVKYLKGSQHRKQKFRECINLVSLLPMRALRQDVPTRWNSTFMMLESALYYRRAFMQLMRSDLKQSLSY